VQGAAPFIQHGIESFKIVNQSMVVSMHAKSFAKRGNRPRMTGFHRREVSTGFLVLVSVDTNAAHTE